MARPLRLTGPASACSESIAFRLFSFIKTLQAIYFKRYRPQNLITQVHTTKLNNSKDSKSYYKNAKTEHHVLKCKGAHIQQLWIAEESRQCYFKRAALEQYTSKNKMTLASICKRHRQWEINLGFISPQGSRIFPEVLCLFLTSCFIQSSSLLILHITVKGVLPVSHHIPCWFQQKGGEDETW